MQKLCDRIVNLTDLAPSRWNYRKRQHRGPLGRPEAHAGPVQLVPDRLLLHLLRLRDPQQHGPQEAASQPLAPQYHGCVGDRHDLDGPRPQLHRPPHRSAVSGDDGSWTVPWCHSKSLPPAHSATPKILSLTTVPSTTSPSGTAAVSSSSARPSSSPRPPRPAPSAASSPSPSPRWTAPAASRAGAGYSSSRG